MAGNRRVDGRVHGGNMGIVMNSKPTTLPVRLTALVCGLSFFLALPSPAMARLGKADRARAEAKAMEAKIEFKSDNHAKAAQLFLEAFAISKAPALMYNAARAYQKGAMPSKAIIVFEQYLELDDLTTAGRAEAKKHIETLRKQVADAKAAPEPAPKTEPKPEPKPKPRVDPKTAPKPEPSAKPLLAVTPKPGAPLPGVVMAPSPEARNKWVTWGLVGGGGLLFIVGVGNMSTATSDLEAANAMDFGKFEAKKIYNDQANAAESTHTSGIWLSLIGLGLGGWGAYRMLTPAPAAAVTRATAWFGRPQLGPSWDGQAQYGLTVGGHFQ